MDAPLDKEYDECYEFATLSVVGENTQFTLAVRPDRKVNGMAMWYAIC